MIARIASSVVYRHPCDCDTASRPLEPGEEPEHRFDVDGEPFPWLISEDGATFIKRGEMYLVSVRIFPIPVDRIDHLHRITAPPYGVPCIGSRVFPWVITGQFTITVEPKSFAVLELTFVGEHVDTDGEIVEMDET